MLGRTRVPFFFTRLLMCVRVNVPPLLPLLLPFLFFLFILLTPLIHLLLKQHSLSAILS